MSAVVLVRCSGCSKRYPINKNKHKDRDVCFCPFCKTPHKIKRRFKFLPNLNWPKEKLHREAEKQYMKEKRRGGWRDTPEPHLMPTTIPDGLLALSMLIRQREMELEKEQAKKSEKPNP